MSLKTNPNCEVCRWRAAKKQKEYRDRMKVENPKLYNEIKARRKAYREKNWAKIYASNKEYHAKKRGGLV